MPARTVDNLVETFIQRTTGDTQPIDRPAIWLNQVAAAKFNGINPQVVGNLIQMHLYGVAWLRCAMAALGATGRLVGKEAHPLELVTGEVVGDRLQCARVIGCCHAIRAICPAIQERAEVHSCERSILLHACLDPHLDGMSPSVDQENLLAGAGDLDRSPGAARQLGGADLVREWVGLAAEAAADRRRDHANARGWQSQHFADLAVDIMRRLRRSPQGHFAANGVAGVGFPVCDTGVRFKRRVVVAFVVEPVFTDVVRRGKTRLHIAKFVRDGFMDIAGTRFIVDFHLWMCQSLVDTHESRQYLVFHFDELHGLVKNIGIQRGNGGNRVAHVADFVDSQGILILAGRKNTKLLR